VIQIRDFYGDLVEDLQSVPQVQKTIGLCSQTNSALSPPEQYLFGGGAGPYISSHANFSHFGIALHNCGDCSVQTKEGQGMQLSPQHTLPGPQRCLRVQLPAALP
jgi:hypothetical protein